MMNVDELFQRAQEEHEAAIALSMHVAFEWAYAHIRIRAHADHAIKIALRRIDRRIAQIGTPDATYKPSRKANHRGKNGQTSPQA